MVLKCRFNLDFQWGEKERLREELGVGEQYVRLALTVAAVVLKWEFNSHFGHREASALAAVMMKVF